jgi:hypothetical protein
MPCSCDSEGQPTLQPQPSLRSTDSFAMTDQAPDQLPPAAGQFSGDFATVEAQPSQMPPTATEQGSSGGITAWNNDKRVTALWAINQNRNSWVYINGVGWKRLSTASDSANLALTLLAAHAKQSQTNYTYRDESDGLIHESYVW